MKKKETTKEKDFYKQKQRRVAKNIVFIRKRNKQTVKHSVHKKEKQTNRKK